MLAKWAPKFGSEIPSKLIEWIPKGTFLNRNFLQSVCHFGEKFGILDDGLNLKLA